MSYGDWRKPESLAWMHKAIALVRDHYPDMPLFFSFAGEPDETAGADLADFDLLDLHEWMTQQNNGEFYRLVGYDYEHSTPKATPISASRPKKPIARARNTGKGCSPARLTGSPPCRARFASRSRPRNAGPSWTTKTGRCSSGTG